MSEAFESGLISLEGEMNDRVVAVFADRDAAEVARSRLVASGVASTRMTVKRVLQPGHRGLSDADTVHSLLHSPELRESVPVSEDAGTVILVVEMVEAEPANGESVDQTDGFDPHDTDSVMRALEQVDGVDIHVVEATPPLDL